MTGSAELLAEADRLLRAQTSDAGGWWPRTVAFIVRAALEQELRSYWDRTAPGTDHVSMRAQLLVLRSKASGDVAREAAAAWHGLSRACHHHAYELAPTAAELRGWLEAVRDLAPALRGTHAAVAST